MSMSLEEHDYIGFSDVPSMENCEKSCVSVGDNERKGKGLNFKATELRLGLPGSESPERETAGHGGGGGGGGEDTNTNNNNNKNGYPLGGGVVPLKGSVLLVSGAKRGFSDTINASSGKWVFPGTGGSENLDLAKGGNLFSPRGGVNGASKTLGVVGAENCNHQSFMPSSNVGKDHTVPQSPKTAQDNKKPPVSASTAAHGVAPAAK